MGNVGAVLHSCGPMITVVVHANKNTLLYLSPNSLVPYLNRHFPHNQYKFVAAFFSCKRYRTLTYLENWSN